MIKFGHSLQKIVECSTRLKEIRKSDLRPGDLVLVTTLNSVYSVRVLGSNQYQVSGGWFDKHGLSPMKTTIAGCTWGGSIIKVNIIAAIGLCLEFGNRVVTSPIQKIEVIPYGAEN